MTTLANSEHMAFLLKDWLGLEQLLLRPRYREQSLETCDALIEVAKRIARDRFLPHFKKADQIEPRFEDGEVSALPEIATALSAFAEAGFLAAPFNSELDGLQVPETVQAIAMAHFMSANVATAAYAMLTIGNARLIAAYGSQAQIDAFVRPQMSGKAFGTMCLSEPQAGSSLADIRVRAQPDGVGPFGEEFRLFGNKMWISGGDHNLSENIFHLVLAKIPNGDGILPAGTSGLSLFIVPKWLIGEDHAPQQRNDIVVAGLNHKMGYRGTTNCLLNFGEGRQYNPQGKSGAVGYLVGPRGAGLSIMFHMMNEARIGVGLGAAALASRSHAASAEYARTRLQGRQSNQDANAPPVPIIEHPDVKRMLLAQKCYSEGALSLVLFASRLVDDRISSTSEEERKRAGDLLGLITPIAKSWSSEWGVVSSDIAIQIHGGYGYTRDYDVEQLYRDNRLNTIHEGTTGIQAIDFTTRKLARDDSRTLDLLGTRVLATVETAKHQPELSGDAQALSDAWHAFRSIAHDIRRADRSSILSNATEIMGAFGHIVVAWILLDQTSFLLGDQTRKTGNLARSKLAACKYFFAHELPKASRGLEICRSLPSLIAETPSAVFDC